MWYKDIKHHPPQKHDGIVQTLSFLFLHRRAVVCLNGVRNFHSFSCPITFWTIQCSAHGSVCCASGFSHSLVLVQRDLRKRHRLWHCSCVQPSHEHGRPDCTQLLQLDYAGNAANLKSLCDHCICHSDALLALFHWITVMSVIASRFKNNKKFSHGALEAPFLGLRRQLYSILHDQALSGQFLPKSMELT